jgi:hypothetical protein
MDLLEGPVPAFRLGGVVSHQLGLRVDVSHAACRLPLCRIHVEDAVDDVAELVDWFHEPPPDDGGRNLLEG